MPYGALNPLASARDEVASGLPAELRDVLQAAGLMADGDPNGETLAEHVARQTVADSPLFAVPARPDPRRQLAVVPSLDVASPVAEGRVAQVPSLDDVSSAAAWTDDELNDMMLTECTPFEMGTDIPRPAALIRRGPPNRFLRPPLYEVA